MFLGLSSFSLLLFTKCTKMLVVHYCVAQMDLWVYQSYTFQGLQKLERSYSTQPIGQIEIGLTSGRYAWRSSKTWNLKNMAHCVGQGTKRGRRKFWEPRISMIYLCSKYVKNCNIFGQILNVWVKLILKKKIWIFFFNV